MYCPKCSQQLASDSTRFCSRCGLEVGGLAEWLAGVGVPAARAEGAPSALASPRRKGMRRGAKLMFIGGALLPIFLGFALIIDEPAPLIVPFILFFVGLALMLYSRIFGEETPPARSSQARPAKLGATPDTNALPPASNISLNGVGGQRVRTSELAQPPSVTEHTTRLLDIE